MRNERHNKRAIGGKWKSMMKIMSRKVSGKSDLTEKILIKLTVRQDKHGWPSYWGVVGMGMGCWVAVVGNPLH